MNCFADGNNGKIPSMVTCRTACLKLVCVLGAALDSGIGTSCLRLRVWCFWWATWPYSLTSGDVKSSAWMFDMLNIKVFLFGSWVLCRSLVFCGWEDRIVWPFFTGQSTSRVTLIYQNSQTCVPWKEEPGGIVFAVPLVWTNVTFGHGHWTGLWK